MLVAACTALNLALRWIRWHALMRRVGARLGTRDSARVYLGTLPAILTPFTVGEVVRYWLVRRRYPVRFGAVASVWLFERATDAAVLASFAALAGGGLGYLVPIAAGWLVVCLGARAYSRGAGAPVFPSAEAVAVAAPATVAAWGFVGLSLAAATRALGESLAVSDALRIFSDATLRGSLVGIPVGTAITGSSIIRALEATAVPPDTAVAAGAVLRWGTAWLAVALGGVVLWSQRRPLAALMRGDDAGDTREHFDALAAGYASEIPEHVRARLVTRKVALMQRRLPERGLDVLDVGCGQGWYAAAMAEAGHRVCAVEASAGQLAEARRFHAERGLAIEALVARAESLPYPDQSFDCVYAINVLHHIEPEATRVTALGEIVRVLRPGGRFFLHEINTANPLFRLYMGYVFPLLRAIDEGTERWLDADALPRVAGAHWETPPHFMTFLPDFLPARLLRALAPLEAWLEASPLARGSAHFMAVLVRDGEPAQRSGP